MDRVAVASDSLLSVGYDSDVATLEVEFRSGRTYQYFLVPRRIYDGLMNADSKGKYLIEHVKDAGFAFRRIA